MQADVTEMSEFKPKDETVAEEAPHPSVAGPYPRRSHRRFSAIEPIHEASGVSFERRPHFLLWDAALAGQAFGLSFVAGPPGRSPRRFR